MMVNAETDENKHHLQRFLRVSIHNEECSDFSEDAHATILEVSVTSAHDEMAKERCSMQSL